MTGKNKCIMCTQLSVTNVLFDKKGSVVSIEKERITDGSYAKQYKRLMQRNVQHTEKFFSLMVDVALDKSIWYDLLAYCKENNMDLSNYFSKTSDRFVIVFQKRQSTGKKSPRYKILRQEMKVKANLIVVDPNILVYLEGKKVPDEMYLFLQDLFDRSAADEYFDFDDFLDDKVKSLLNMDVEKTLKDLGKKPESI